MRVARYWAVARDVARVACILPLVERQRRRLSLHAAVAAARGRSRWLGSPSADDRARLRRVIGAIDRRLPDGGNCVRRALLEMSLNTAAARERLLAGFRSGGGVSSGHAWLESQPATERYDAVMAI